MPNICSCLNDARFVLTVEYIHLRGKSAVIRISNSFYVASSRPGLDFESDYGRGHRMLVEASSDVDLERFLAALQCSRDGRAGWNYESCVFARVCERVCTYVMRVCERERSSDCDCTCSCERGGCHRACRNAAGLLASTTVMPVPVVLQHRREGVFAEWTV